MGGNGCTFYQSGVSSLRALPPLRLCSPAVPYEQCPGHLGRAMYAQCTRGFMSGVDITRLVTRMDQPQEKDHQLASGRPTLLTSPNENTSSHRRIATHHIARSDSKRDPEVLFASEWQTLSWRSCRCWHRTGAVRRHLHLHHHLRCGPGALDILTGAVALRQSYQRPLGSRACNSRLVLHQIRQHRLHVLHLASRHQSQRRP